MNACSLSLDAPCANLVNYSKAVLNILDDTSQERSWLVLVQRAMLNILDDLTLEKGYLEACHQAAMNILEDVNLEMAKSEKANRAMVWEIAVRKRVEESLRRANAVALSANKELEAFSYTVSHDLRAPLRAVDGFSRIVIEDYGPRLDDEGRRMLDVIHSETLRMGQMVDELLAFTRLGQQPMKPSVVDMTALAREVFDELQAMEPDRKLQFELQALPPAFGVTAMIRQVWLNLIGNAVKFTRDRDLGVIEVGAQLGEDGAWIYHVKDNGAGFDMRFVSKIFGVFQRLHGPDEYPGAGLGLALAQRIIQRHGGRIWAKGEVGKGAAFFFTLPSPANPKSTHESNTPPPDDHE